MSEGKKPLRKVRSGKVSISIWKSSIKRKDGSTVDGERACVQHSRQRRDTKEWLNQQIWLNVDELRDLATAVDKLNSVEEGEESPSSSSIRAHCIVEYVKANSIDAGLDVYDLEERTVSEVLREYGIRVELKSWEEKIVADEFRELIERREFAEMARMVHNGNIDIGFAAGFR